MPVQIQNKLDDLNTPKTIKGKGIGIVIKSFVQIRVASLVNCELKIMNLMTPNLCKFFQKTQRGKCLILFLEANKPSKQTQTSTRKRERRERETCQTNKVYKHDVCPNLKYIL
jgi:hypothetical protein